ncbi:hypothetical protein CTI12_AA281870 [Artemisia annua]|uniref:Uncharacterized protein n=1 Tax=Artemisia annua TaxID=35608 RepID=A0A2U1NCT5_ARTAN|nr:hypothetical protein CTI12_AA281870 [Artemisia annua]
MEGHDARFKRIGSTLLLDEPFEWSNDTSLDFFAAAIDEDEEDTAGKQPYYSHLETSKVSFLSLALYPEPTDNL